MFGVNIVVGMRCIVFELYMRKKNDGRRTKSHFSLAIFLTVGRINESLEVYFVLELLRVFIYKSFASLCCGFLEAVPRRYVQDAILNLPNPYLRSTTMLLGTTRKT